MRLSEWNAYIRKGATLGPTVVAYLAASIRSGQLVYPDALANYNRNLLNLATWKDCGWGAVSEAYIGQAQELFKQGHPYGDDRAVVLYSPEKFPEPIAWGAYAERFQKVLEQAKYGLRARNTFNALIGAGAVCYMVCASCGNRWGSSMWGGGLFPQCLYRDTNAGVPRRWLAPDMGLATIAGVLQTRVGLAPAETGPLAYVAAICSGCRPQCSSCGMAKELSWEFLDSWLSTETCRECRGGALTNVQPPKLSRASLKRLSGEKL